MDNIRDVFHRYIASYGTGNGKNVAAFLHPRHVYHPPGGAKPMDKAERVADEKFFFMAFSDIEAIVDVELAEDDKLAARLTMRCTHTGEYQGIAASNRRIEIAYIEIVRFADGLIVEEWAEFDMMSIAGQLG
jgi:predicted ester cyclase